MARKSERQEKGIGVEWLIAGVAACLTGASLYFNIAHSAEIGGGTVVAAIGFAGCKDIGIAYAISGSSAKMRIIAGLVGIMGFVISCLCAIGGVSGGRDAAANPLQAQIDAYDTAVGAKRRIEERLSGRSVLSVAEAEARRDRVVVDAYIRKRTDGCKFIDKRPDGGSVSSSVAAVNRQECRALIEAEGAVRLAKEHEKLTAELAEAEAVISKGRPASADSQAQTIADALGLTRVDGVAAWLNLAFALAIEVTSPLVWAMMGIMRSDRAPSEPVRQPSPAPSQIARASNVSARMTDDEAEAIILADIALGIHRSQEDYAAQFGKSVATISRMIDRLTKKPDAKLADKRMGTRRILYAV